MPIPLSATVIVRASWSYETRIRSGPSAFGSSARESSSIRKRSMASEAFEISSRRNISLLLYNELIIKSSSCTTSAWKLNFSWFSTVIGSPTSGRTLPTPALAAGR
jgi:hypothetical protein